MPTFAQIPSWILFATAATLLAGLRGYWLKRTADRVGYPQHVHLLSGATTVVLSGAILLYSDVPVPDAGPFALIAFLAGLSYAVYSVLASFAQEFLKLSTYQAVLRLSGFLPVLYFYFSDIPGEQLSLQQGLSVLSSMFPLILSSYFASDKEASRPSRLGLVVACGAMLALSGAHIINKAGMDPDYRIDQILLVFASNVVVVLILLGTVVIKGDRASITPPLLRAGLIAGGLNVLTYWCYLEAMTSGRASIVTPVYSQHVFVSSMLSAGEDRRSFVGLILLAVWALVSVVLMFGREV